MLPNVLVMREAYLVLPSILCIMYLPTKMSYTCKEGTPNTAAVGEAATDGGKAGAGSSV